jgi:hypothetical protein
MPVVTDETYRKPADLASWTFCWAADWSFFRMDDERAAIGVPDCARGRSRNLFTFSTHRGFVCVRRPIAFAMRMGSANEIE